MGINDRMKDQADFKIFETWRKKFSFDLLIKKSYRFLGSMLYFLFSCIKLYLAKIKTFVQKYIYFQVSTYKYNH